MRTIRIPAYAKVNLRLEVLGKRADGYHELRTIFQTVSLHDTLEFRSSRRPGISLQIQGNETLAKEEIEKNLVYRAVDALRRESRVRPGVEILLQKRIPAGRGLGGGSSDAAAALLGYLAIHASKVRNVAPSRHRRRPRRRRPLLSVWGNGIGHRQRRRNLSASGRPAPHATDRLAQRHPRSHSRCLPLASCPGIGFVDKIRREP